MFYRLAQKALFIAEPERAQHIALEALRLASATRATSLLCSQQMLPVECMGLKFANPVGLAAGLDKDGDYIDALGQLGFGFIEIGSVLPRPQPGNPAPRVFRLPEKNAVINRLGFNSKGVDHTVRQLEQSQFGGVLGINVGKNRDTPIDAAADDYAHVIKRVYPFADYITVNISSPNTPGLRALQDENHLDALLNTLTTLRARLADKHRRFVPLLVKVSPDLEDEEMRIMADSFSQNQIEGVIATNTTITRNGVKGERYADEEGGLSGAPLLSGSNRILKKFRAFLPPEIALIGLGGITCGDDAAEKMKRGASLVQFYTGFIYKGPELISQCVNSIRDSSANESH